MSGIDSCPAEVLHLVFNLLSPTELYTLCLVNRPFRTSAEPLLYSKIRWRWEDPKDLPPIIPLLRSFIYRPELATYVRSLKLEGECLSNSGFRRPTPLITVSNAELDSLIVFVQGLGVPYGDLWTQMLRKGVLDAFIALLLVQPLNLRVLEIGPVFLQRSTLIGMVLDSVIRETGKDGLPDFTHLTDVSVLSGVGWDREREAGVQKTPDFFPLFYLPNIERMAVSIWSSSAFKWPTADLPDLSRLKSLDLRCIREAHLADILSLTKNLEKLTWEWYYDFGLDDEFNKPIVDLDQIASALACTPSSLTEIKILAGVGLGGGDISEPGIRIKGSLNTMADLRHVKKLKIPLAFLVGFAQDTMKRLQDVMPPNIESLTLTYDLSLQEDLHESPDIPEWMWEASDIFELLQYWLGVWKSCTPCLREVLVIGKSPSVYLGDWDLSLMNQLNDLSIQTGIHLDVAKRE
ncbi:unnamed protein product, partial [Penicillium pancosmium]